MCIVPQSFWQRYLLLMALIAIQVCALIAASKESSYIPALVAACIGLLCVFINTQLHKKIARRLTYFVVFAANFYTFYKVTGADGGSVPPVHDGLLALAFFIAALVIFFRGRARRKAIATA